MVGLCSLLIASALGFALGLLLVPFIRSPCLGLGLSSPSFGGMFVYPQMFRLTFPFLPACLCKREA